MKTFTIIESINNIFDVGVIIESLNNARKYRFKMDIVEFSKQLFWGKGYYNITPPQLSEKMEKSGNDVLVIDLREKEQFEKGNIETAISSPFDAFLKTVLVDQKYADYLDTEIVLVCDTGHMSRVAGAILAEEGFKKIYSLSRGMRRWNRWQKMLSQYNGRKYKKNSLLASCCGIE
jgi:rhodanese-related sulfurtransferase